MNSSEYHDQMHMLFKKVKDAVTSSSASLKEKENLVAHVNNLEETVDAYKRDMMHFILPLIKHEMILQKQDK